MFELKRAFNNRLGVRRGNDRIPQQLLIPMSNGTNRRTPNMEMMLQEYYRVRDWDWETGRPTRKRLEALGMAEVAEDLWS